MKYILYFLLILFCVLFLIAFLTRNYRNRYKLFMVFGKKGSGKSTFLVKQIIRYMKKGYVVYTNMPEVVIDGVRLVDIDELGKFIPVQNSLLIVDEVGMIWDNRNFKSFSTEVRDFFKLQRHYHVVCFLASQSFDVDKKLRDLTDGMYLCICIFNVFSIAKRITRKIVLTESTSQAESRISENLRFAPIWNWQFTFIPRFTKYFDSFTVPAMPELRYRLISSDICISLKGKKKKKSAVQQLYDLNDDVIIEQNKNRD